MKCLRNLSVCNWKDGLTMHFTAAKKSRKRSSFVVYSFF